MRNPLAYDDSRKPLLDFTKHYKQVTTQVRSHQLNRERSPDRGSAMAATMERLDEYRTYNSQFCKRIFDYLSIMVVAQVGLCHVFSHGYRVICLARPKSSWKVIMASIELAFVLGPP